MEELTYYVNGQYLNCHLFSDIQHKIDRLTTFGLTTSLGDTLIIEVLEMLEKYQELAGFLEQIVSEETTEISSQKKTRDKYEITERIFK